MTHTQEPANGRISAARVESKDSHMVRVKFKQDVRHPDYGEIEEGEVLDVTYEYAEEYRRLGFAEESTERLSRRSQAAKDE